MTKTVTTKANTTMVIAKATKIVTKITVMSMTTAQNKDNVKYSDGSNTKVNDDRIEGD